MIRAKVIASVLLSVLPPKKLREPETFHFGGLRYSETRQGSRTRLATLLGVLRRALSFSGARCLLLTRVGVGWRHVARLVASAPSSDNECRESAN